MKYYVVDAFAEKPFNGNPAGICIAASFPDEWVMKQIAAETNLSETAFVVSRQDGDFDIRWFTPLVEIDLCGHATLGAAFVIKNFINPVLPVIRFHSASGGLRVTQEGDLYEMDFPSRMPSPISVTSAMRDAIGEDVQEALSFRDLFLVVRNEAIVRNLSPNLTRITELPGYTSVVVTAKGQKADFVSRCFAPLEGIPEDPVTGSTHASLIPFWSARLKRKTMTALQLSARGGKLLCRDAGERVFIAGKAVLFLQGTICLV